MPNYSFKFLCNSGTFFKLHHIKKLIYDNKFEPVSQILPDIPIIVIQNEYLVIERIFFFLH